MDRIHALTRNNAKIIATAGYCRCLNCKSDLSAATALIDGCRADDGKTLLCPSCGVDALVPSMTRDLIEAIHEEYFSKTTALEDL